MKMSTRKRKKSKKNLKVDKPISVMYHLVWQMKTVQLSDGYT